MSETVWDRAFAAYAKQRRDDSHGGGAIGAVDAMLEAVGLHPDAPAQPDAERRIADLEAALADAIDCVHDWGAYAAEYFQEKHDLVGDLSRLRAVLAAS